MAEEEDKEPRIDAEPPGPCGEKYRHLIRTDDGYTYENRCGQWCDTGNIVTWGNAARELSARVNRAWKRLIYVETGPGDHIACGPGGDPEECPSNAIHQEVNAYFGEADELPGWWDLLSAQFIWTPSKARGMVNHAVANMEQGICFLDRIQSGIVLAGGEEIHVPGAPTEEPKSDEPSFWDKLTTAAVATTVLLAVGGGIYYIAKRRGTTAARASLLGE